MTLSRCPDVCPDVRTFGRRQTSGRWDICARPLTPVIETPTVTKAAAALLPLGALNSEIWVAWTKSIAAETGVKGKALFMPIRLALTGRDSGPEIAPLLAIMGRERVIRRLQGETA